MEDIRDKINYIPLEDIIPNRFQPRLAFDEKELTELSNSIIKYGVIQPIVVRNIGGKYEIIAGERRYKASCMAGLSKVPAIINNTDDNTSAEIALLENIQRKNLTVIEEAQSYKKLIDRGFTQEDIAKKIGVSQSSIANKLRLLNLPKEVQNALLYNKISERHARCLLTLNDEEKQKEILNRIIEEKLTVKQTEDEISRNINSNFINTNNSVENTENIENFNSFNTSSTIPLEKTNVIPESIQRFLNPEPNPQESLTEYKEPQEFAPEILDINNNTNSNTSKEFETEKIEEVKEYIDNNNVINPFQNDFSLHNPLFDLPKEENIQVNNDEIDNQNNNSYEDVFNNNAYNNYDNSNANINNLDILEIDEINENNNSNIISESTNLDENLDLPNIISKIRDYVLSLDENGDMIETTELDLNDRYQIIIDINKNA